MPRYSNPWSSYTPLSAIEKVSSLSLRLKFPSETNERIPIRQKIDFPSSPPRINDGPRIIRLGHASVYLLLPHATPAEGREWRGILLDPVFSKRCSPVSFLGPQRRFEAPCRVEDLPRVDVVFISHDHYDDLDDYRSSRFSSIIRPLSVYHADTLGNVVDREWYKGDCPRFILGM